MKLKILSLLSALLMLSMVASSQINKRNTWNLSIGGDFLFPENLLRQTHGAGYGATVKGEYLFAKHLSLTISSGIYSLTGKQELLNPTGVNITGIPVKLGLRYYMGNFYIGGEGGFVNQSGYRPRNGFSYSFSIGDELITGKNGNSLDISLRHEAWLTERARGFAGLRIAYEFRLK